MAVRDKTKSKRRSRPLYHSAKISEYRFRKVLWHFVRDHTATETAHATKLSINSTAAIFRKLRVFFTEVGLFVDISANRLSKSSIDARRAAFHRQRIQAKRGMKGRRSGPNYDFAESNWRFHFHVLMTQRESERVYSMMHAHLLELIRLCGPVGGKPNNTLAGTYAIRRHIDQRVAWLERNAIQFNTPLLRARLKALRIVGNEFSWPRRASR